MSKPNGCIESRETHGVDLFGPTPGNHRWQFQQGRGFDLSSFQIDWEAKQACLPGWQAQCPLAASDRSPRQCGGQYHVCEIRL